MVLFVSISNGIFLLINMWLTWRLHQLRPPFGSPVVTVDESEALAAAPPAAPDEPGSAR